jgi:hypothetical protein
MLWHAFLFLGLRFFPLFFFLLGGLHCLFLVMILYTLSNIDFIRLRFAKHTNDGDLLSISLTEFWLPRPKACPSALDIN